MCIGGTVSDSRGLIPGPIFLYILTLLCPRKEGRSIVNACLS